MEVLIVQDLKFLICLLQTLVNICNQLICVTYVWVQSCEILLPPSPYHMIDCDHVGLLRTPYHHHCTCGIFQVPIRSQSPCRLSVD